MSVMTATVAVSGSGFRKTCGTQKRVSYGLFTLCCAIFVV